LGEDEPVNTTHPYPRVRRKAYSKTYSRRFERCLVREEIPPGRLAYEAGVSRQGLVRKRADSEAATVIYIAKIVRAMRRLGRDVRAADLFDVGEDETGPTR
jgi:hypothetical protein